LDPEESAADQTSAINETVLDMTSDLEYASHFRQDLTSPDHLNVSSTVVKNAKLEPVLRQYVDWLGENTKLGWYLFSVSRVPCIYVRIPRQRCKLMLTHFRDGLRLRIS
jgi:hypothetical protein